MLRGIFSSPRRFIANAVTFVRPAWTLCNELAMGVRTISFPQLNGGLMRATLSQSYSAAKHQDGCPYETIDYWNVRKVVRHLKLTADDVFYDIGCGMGRVICVTARMPIKRCVGIELSKPLSEAAQQNVSRLRRRKTPVTIISGDAAEADLSDGTVYFMFNPFGAATLSDVLDNVRASLKNNPRPIRIVYYNSCHLSVVEKSAWLEKSHEFKTFGGLSVTFWRNRGENIAELDGLAGVIHTS